MSLNHPSTGKNVHTMNVKSWVVKLLTAIDRTKGLRSCGNRAKLTDAKPQQPTLMGTLGEWVKFSTNDCTGFRPQSSRQQRNRRQQKKRLHPHGWPANRQRLDGNQRLSKRPSGGDYSAVNLARCRHSPRWHGVGGASGFYAIAKMNALPMTCDLVPIACRIAQMSQEQLGEVNLT